MPIYIKPSESFNGIRPGELTVIVAQTDVGISHYEKQQRVRQINRQLQEEIDDFEGILQDE